MMAGVSLRVTDVCNMKDMKKIYYHVVMKGSRYVVEESEHRDCSKVPFSVNSYVNHDRAQANISDPTSRYYGQVKKFW